jgi:acetolactate synthase-1/2/3 large subunit
MSKIAAAYNIPSMVIPNQKNLREDVRRALAMEGPVVVDVHVIPDEVRAPRLQSYQKPDGSFVSKPLEDLFPFLDREEFRSQMIIPTLED